MYVECELAMDRRIFFELFCFQLIYDWSGNTKATMVTTVIVSNNPISNNAIEQLPMLPWKILSILIWCLLSSEVDSRIHEGHCAFFEHVKYIFPSCWLLSLKFIFYLLLFYYYQFN